MATLWREEARYRSTIVSAPIDLATTQHHLHHIQQIQYLWEHWKFNADQRIKAFNFFVVFSIFANGGVFAAVEKCVSPLIFMLIAGFICVLAVVFFVIDVRSERLLGLTEPGIKEFEGTLSPTGRLFHMDAENRNSFIRFKFAFRALFAVQFVFGIAVAVFAIASMCPETMGWTTLLAGSTSK